MTPLHQDQKPSWKPQKGPKIEATHWAYPLFSGKIEHNSAVTKASGTLQTKGKIIKLRRQSMAPPFLTESYY